MEQVNNLFSQQWESKKYKTEQYPIFRNPQSVISIRLSFFLSLIFIKGYGVIYDKGNYIQENEQFINEVKTDYKSYSTEDWENVEEKYELFTVAEFEKYKDQLTAEALIKLKIGANDLMEKSKCLMRQAENRLDGVLESNNI